MDMTSTASWYKANIHYLTTAVMAVHRALECYVARKQNKPYEMIPENPLTLETIAASMPKPPALETLCATFNLSPFDRKILLLCVAMAMIPNFSALCAIAHGNPQMLYPTFSLALEVFPQGYWSSFTPNAPLRRWQLLQVGTNQVITLCALQIDESILHYLMGEPYEDVSLSNMIKPMPLESPHPLQPSHQQLAERLAIILSATGEADPLPSVQLCGLQVDAKWAIAATGCAIAGRSLQVMSARRLLTYSNDLHHLIQRWERLFILTHSAFLLDCDELNTIDPMREAGIVQLIEEINTPLIINTVERLYSPRRPIITLDIPKLTHHEQRSLWHNHLGTVVEELNGHVDALVSQFNLTTPAIQAACLEIKGEKAEYQADYKLEAIEEYSENNDFAETPRSAIQNRLWDICRTMARPRLDDLAARIDSTATWDDLVLPEQQRQILRDIAAHVRQRAKVYEEWGFAGKQSRGLGISALFSGASGTGKTMAAEVLAKEFRLDLYRIDLSAVVSKYIGETEKNLRRIFDAAESGGAVLLFDEADALFGKRTQVKDSHDRHANVEVSYLLQRMEAYQGLAILTTNLKASLDQAFLRRIRFIVPFPFPDGPSRAEIWRRIFPKQTPTQGLDYNKLAKLNVAGGNIRNIAMNAAFLAADSGELVMMKHILQSAKSEYLKLEQPLTDAEIKGWI